MPPQHVHRYPHRANRQRQGCAPLFSEPGEEDDQIWVGSSDKLSGGPWEILGAIKKNPRGRRSTQDPDKYASALSLFTNPASPPPLKVYTFQTDTHRLHFYLHVRNTTPTVTAIKHVGHYDGRNPDLLLRQLRVRPHIPPQGYPHACPVHATGSAAACPVEEREMSG